MSATKVLSSRKLRRIEQDKARKLARKQGFPTPAPASTTATQPEPYHELLKATIASFMPLVPPSASSNQPEKENAPAVPEPGFPLPSLSSISPARIAASQNNGKKSHGPLTPETQAISAQNHTVHGLARHINGTFKLLGNEDPAAFEAFKQSLSDEHQPSTPTENLLVNNMVESHWLAARAQRLQETCINPENGEITDEKKFNIYTRYQTTHTRAFHKSFNGLQKLRSEKRKAELGFEAQRLRQDSQRVVNERHEMKKETHYWDVLRKDGEAFVQIAQNTKLIIQANRENPEFEAKFNEELAKHGLRSSPNHVAVNAA